MHERVCDELLGESEVLVASMAGETSTAVHGSIEGAATDIAVSQQEACKERGPKRFSRDQVGNQAGAYLVRAVQTKK